MLIAYIVLLFLFFYVPPYKAATGSDIHEDYLSPLSTLPIKGLFTFIVMLSHYRGYVTLPVGVLNSLFMWITGRIGQLMVAIFFFYSGFGLLESVKRKGSVYIKEFPQKRLFVTWLSFAICIIVYLLLALIKKEKYSLSTVLLAFVGWESIGNSNWFMFVTFALYALFYLSFSIVKSGLKKQILVFTALSGGLFLFLYYKKDTWWYNTLQCMAAGMWYSFYKDSIDATVKKKERFTLILIFTMILFLLLYIVTDMRVISIPIVVLNQALYSLCSILFCLLIVLFSMKITVRSSFCSFLGKHVFSIYILQRIFFSNLRLFIRDPYMLFICAAVATIVAAFIFDKLFAKLKKRL